MIGDALRRWVARGESPRAKAALAGGLAALVTAGQAMGAIAPSGEEKALDFQEQDPNDTEDTTKHHHDHHDHHHHGGRPVGYRHDRTPALNDGGDASGGDNTQEDPNAPAASPVPAPIAASAPSDVGFV